MDLANDDARLRAFWHPVARADRVGAVPRRVLLLGEALVVVRLAGPPARGTDRPPARGTDRPPARGTDRPPARGSDGEVVVLPDRCPHRSARLSDGSVVDGCLACPYHGWRFDAGGRCRLVPASGAGAAVPSRAHIEPLRVRIEGGLVYVALDPPRSPVAGSPGAAGGDRVCWLPEVTVACGAAAFVDNFLDVAHFPFVHAGTFGAAEDALVGPYDVAEDVGDGLVVRYEHVAENHEDPGVAAGLRPLVQPRVMTLAWRPPFAATLRLEHPLAGTHQTIVAWARPETATTTVLYQALVRPAAEPVAGDAAAVAYELAVLAEDVRILEGLPPGPWPLDPTAAVHTRADRMTVELRRRLAAILRP